MVSQHDTKIGHEVQDGRRRHEHVITDENDAETAIGRKPAGIQQQQQHTQEQEQEQNQAPRGDLSNANTNTQNETRQGDTTITTAKQMKFSQQAITRRHQERHSCWRNDQKKRWPPGRLKNGRRSIRLPKNSWTMRTTRRTTRTRRRISRKLHRSSTTKKLRRHRK